MSRKTQHTFAKRERERKKAEKAKQKLERRAERKEEAEEPPASGVDDPAGDALPDEDAPGDDEDRSVSG